MACVRMDKYTPVTRLRKASQPNTSASRPGTSTTMSSCKNRLSAKAHMAGNSEEPTTPKIWLPMASEISCGVGGSVWPERLRITIPSVRAYISHMPTA